MRSLTKNKIKGCLITAGSALLATVLALSGVAIAFGIKNKNKGGSAPTISDVTNKLDFAVDAWDGDSLSSENFISNYAGRGDKTRTIDSASSFIYFINEVNAGNSFDNYTIYLNKSIDLNGHTVESIGSEAYPFKGTFDGGYYTIYNANISGNGLFGVTNSATIKNVGLYNSKINSNEEITGALVGKAINTNIENTFVRLEEINSENKVGGLVGEFISNSTENCYAEHDHENTVGHQIINSFVDTGINAQQVAGLVYSVDTNKSSENAVIISNSYYTESENAIALVDSKDYVSTVNVVKATNLNDFKNWDYSARYEDYKTWTDYAYLEGSPKLSFRYPLLSEFVKVYLTGSCYEANVTNGATTEQVKNLPDAIEKASLTDGEVNLLVEKIFMEERAEVDNGTTVVVKSVKDTTIVRGEHNNDSMFVATNNSKLVLGEEATNFSNEATPTLTLDGNRDYVEENNLESGALVVAYGGDVEIHENVKIQNNINTNVKYGGGVLLYGINGENSFVNADIENCSSEKDGGGICSIGEVPSSIGSISYCHAGGNGGAFSAIGTNDLEGNTTLTKMSNLYGDKLNIQPAATITTQASSSTILKNGNIYQVTTTAYNGGAFYMSGSASLGFPTTGNVTFNECKGPSGGAIYYTSSTNLTVQCATFTSNSATDNDTGNYGRGGAIYYESTATFIVKNTTFESNSAKKNVGGTYTDDGVYGDGGAIYSTNTINFTNASGSTSTTKFIENTAEGIGGAIYGDVNFENSSSSIGDNLIHFNRNESANSLNTYYGPQWYSPNEITITKSTVKIFDSTSYPVSIAIGTNCYINADSVSSLTRNSSKNILIFKVQPVGYTTGTLTNASKIATYDSSMNYHIKDVDTTVGEGEYGVRKSDDGKFWICKPIKVVEFYANGGEFTNVSLTTTSSGGDTYVTTACTYGETYNEGTTAHRLASFSKYSDEYLVSKMSVSYTGYIFNGWFTSRTGGTEVKLDTVMTLTSTGRRALYAQWVPATYTVTLNNNSATTAGTTSVTATYGSAMPDITPPTKTGHTFDGYFYLVGATVGSAAEKYYNSDGTSAKDYDLTESITLTAIWITESYTITFDENGGSEVTDGSYAYGATLPTPTKTGYTFNGWCTAESSNNGTGTAYTTCQDYGDNGASKTLYAKWTKESYTITFDENGGSAVTDGSYAYGATLPTSTKTGYTFKGWCAAESSNNGTGTAYTTCQDYGDNGATKTLYAQWTKESYTLTFDENGGSSVTDGSYSYGATLPTSTKTGYTFKGWCAAESSNNGTGTAYTTCQDYGDNGATKTLYAQWTANTYTVSYNGNGNTGGSTANSTHTYDVAKALTANGFTKTGYTFAGWATSASGSVAYSNSQSVTNLTATDGGTVTLYAKWTANTYTVAYNGNGNTGGSTSSSSHTYGVAKNLTANGFTKTGYAFAGWATSTSGAVAYTNSQSVTNLTATNGATFTLYAKWTKESYTITFDENSGSSVTDGSYSYGATLPTSTRTGYTFNGWCTAESSNNGTGTVYTTCQDWGNNGATKTLYAKWTKESYTISFDENGGSEVTDGSYSYGATLPTSTKTGYTFKGWCAAESSNNGTGTAYTTCQDYGDNGATKTLYAQWTANTYTVSYNGNGNTGGSTANSTHTYDVAKALTANGFTKTGYTFAGWATSASGSVAYSNSQSVTNLTATNGATFTLYAKWTANTYTVAYNGNGNTGGSTANSTHTYDVAKALTANGFTKTGYTFAGWATSASGSVAYSNSQSVTNLTATNGATFTLYAKWTANTYKLTYNTNGGNSIASVDKAYASTFTTAQLPTPTKAGYTFNGWYNNSSYSTQVTTSSTLTTSTATFANVGTAGTTATIYAKWTANTYKLTYNTNGGNSIASVDKAYNTAFTADELDKIPTRDGYKFSGWQDQNGGAINEGDLFTTSTAKFANVGTAGTTATIYACWTINRYNITYNLNGGEFSEDTTVPTTYTVGASTTLPEPVKVGHTFKYWTDTSGNQVATISATSTGDKTFTANWQANNYTVTLDNNAGAISGVTAGSNSTVSGNEITATFDKEATFTSTATKTGYTFVGYSQFNWEQGSITIANGQNSPEDGQYREYRIRTSYYEVNPESKCCINLTSSEDIVIRGVYEYDSEYNFVEYTPLVSKSKTLTLQETTSYVRLVVCYRDDVSKLMTDDLTEFDLSISTVEGATLTNGTIINGRSTTTVKNLVPSGNVILYPQFVPNAYTLTYDANGGTVEPTSKQVDFDSKYGELPIPTKEGYKIIGWFTDKTGGTQVTSETTMTTLGATIYAHWEAEKYTVTFNANGGTVDPTSKSVTFDSVYGDLPTPTKTGYTFDGWYLDEETLITKEEIVKTAEDHTLVAHWTSKQVQVNITTPVDWAISLEGSSVSGEYYEVGDEIALVATILQDNITFYRWYKDGAVYEIGETVAGKSTTYTITPEDAEAGTAIEFSVESQYRWLHYAYTEFSSEADGTGGLVSDIWQLGQGYDIGDWSVQGHGGGCEIKSESYLYTPAMYVKANPGYYFYGWFLREIPTSESDLANAIALASDCDYIESETYGNYYSYKYDITRVNPADSQVGGGEFYALFLPRTDIVVTFDAQGGTVSPESQEVTYKSTYGELPIPKRDFYTFLGWYTEAEGGTEVTKTSNVTATDNHTLYARWKANTLTFAYHLNGGTSIYSAFSNDKDPCYSHGLKYGSILGQNGLTDANYTRVEKTGYSVDSKYYNTKADGTGVKIEMNTVYSLGTVEGGMDLISILSDDPEMINVVNALKVGNATLDIYMIWTPITYTITYIGDEGAEYASPKPTSYTIESADIKLINPTLEGYTFAGWTGTDLTKTETTVIITTGSTGNRTYTAHWNTTATVVWETAPGVVKYTCNKESNFVLKLLKGSTIVETVTIENSTGGTYNFETNMKQATGSYKVTIEATPIDTNYNPSTATTSASKVVSSVTLSKATDEHSTNGISGFAGAGKYIEGENVTIQANIVEGYEFVRWNEESVNLTSNPYNFTMSNQNATFVATARTETYTISYDMNMDGLTTSNPTEYNIATETFKLINPSDLTGYTFVGWTGSNGLEPKTEVYVEKGTTGNLNFKAEWDVTINLSASGSLAGHTYGVTVVEHTKGQADSEEQEYTSTFKLRKGKVFTITAFTNLKADASTNSYEFVRISYAGNVSSPISSTLQTQVENYQLLYHKELELKGTINFEYIEAYKFTVTTVENGTVVNGAITGFALTEVNKDKNIIVNYGDFYAVSNQATVSFTVNSTPTIPNNPYLYVGISYISNGVEDNVGTGGNQSVIIADKNKFVQNANYPYDYDIGTYHYQLSNDAKVSSIKLNLVMSAVINLGEGITTGSLTLTSSAGTNNFNKVIDASTKQIIIYNGQWVISAESNTTGLGLEELKAVFSDSCTVTQSGNNYIVTINKQTTSEDGN